MKSDTIFNVIQVCEKVWHFAEDLCQLNGSLKLEMEFSFVLLLRWN